VRARSCRPVRDVELLGEALTYLLFLPILVVWAGGVFNTGLFHV